MFYDLTQWPLQIKGSNSVELTIYVIGELYNIFDIYIIMYFGNEIKLSSDKLSWQLYESGWIDRSESIKKDVLIFGEFLMQPIQLTILMIYPLTLETFTRVCKYEKEQGPTPSH